ncbi:MAG TPA: ABC transporter ATP-binding protein [Longimicrobiales bacterium]
MRIIEVSDLTKRYGRLTAVDRISFTVEQGQVFGFLGPNGSGKTTTIGLLLGIVHPDGGTIRLFEQYGMAELHTARRRIGATLETPNFYPYLSGRDNLRVVAKIKEASEADVSAALDAVGLTPRQGDRFSKYSLGMKQRLAIAGAMMGDPELVILDEPANGLDPEGMREIREIIHGLAGQGRTIFVSSHLLYEVERTCTHVAIIKKGRILTQGPLDQLVRGTSLARVRSADREALLRAVGEYPAVVRAEPEGADVLLELRDEDLAALNRFLAEREVYLSHLVLQRQSLEDVFIDLTGDRPDLAPEEAAA